MKDWLTDHLAEWFYAVFGGLVIWVARRATAKVDMQEARIQALERDKVTRTDIEDLRESISSSISQSNARIEARTDEILLYLVRSDNR